MAPSSLVAALVVQVVSPHAWPRSYILVLTLGMAALMEHGSVWTSGRATATWFTQVMWPRSPTLVPSPNMAALQPIDSLRFGGRAPRLWFRFAPRLRSL